MSDNETDWDALLRAHDEAQRTAWDARSAVEPRVINGLKAWAKHSDERDAKRVSWDTVSSDIGSFGSYEDGRIEVTIDEYGERSNEVVVPREWIVETERMVSEAQAREAELQAEFAAEKARKAAKDEQAKVRREKKLLRELKAKYEGSDV